MLGQVQVEGPESATDSVSTLGNPVLSLGGHICPSGPSIAARIQIDNKSLCKQKVIVGVTA